MSQIHLSYWNKTVVKDQYQPLEEDLETDTLIIGGGITGVTCAYCLAQKGMEPVLIESGELCEGTTGNTTGKLTVQHEIIYNNIVKKYGWDFAKSYADSQKSAINFIRQAVKKESIDCQLADNTAYVYAILESEVETLEKEYETAVKLGIDAKLKLKPPFPEGCRSILGYSHQAVFHPVRYVNALAKAAAADGAKLYCGTKAVKVEDGDWITVYCENKCRIKAKHLVMATQYPIFDGPNLFFARLFAKRTYGIAVQAKRDWPDGSYINMDDPSRSVRTHVESGKRILIVVGEGHATGRGEEDMEQHFERLMQFAEEIAGIETVLGKWSAQDYETPDQIPYIGRISDHSNVFVASGFGKWGLTNGTLAGNMIADLITDGSCQYEQVYSRKRADYLTSPGKAITGVFTPVGELIKSKLERPENIDQLKLGEGRVIRYQGQKAGIYRDVDNTVTILDISCTHMSTELNFNSAEKTWDCPAHGGRFRTDGTLLEGPPKHSLKVLFHGNYSDLTAEN
ncbi:MAG: FAD-dependent oxidoreductase [Ruminococcaceae bacterium]|nr:FAD-dependent oxidoreductase [Oscillospiraceae bacterium]